MKNLIKYGFVVLFSQFAFAGPLYHCDNSEIGDVYCESSLETNSCFMVVPNGWNTCSLVNITSEDLGQDAEQTEGHYISTSIELLGDKNLYNQSF